MALGVFLNPVHLILHSLKQKNMLCSSILGWDENEMYLFCYQQEITKHKKSLMTT